jgi:hypothetical protein
MVKKKKKEDIQVETETAEKKEPLTEVKRVRRFKKRPDIAWLNLNGRTITEDMILEGEEWAQYCPQYLVEILEESAVKPLEFKKEE